MKVLKPNINLDRCNAYSALAHMYAAISVENRPVFATVIKAATKREVPDDMKGGIIVFPQGADAELSDIKQIVQKHDTAGWTIGSFFKGHLTRKDGIVYSEDSLSVEIIGVSVDALTDAATDFYTSFSLKSVLIKYYAERNRILVVE